MRVNVGCGATPTAGWANLDNSLTVRVAHWPVLIRMLLAVRILDSESTTFAEIANQKNIKFANASARIPYESNSVEVLYSSHMIEHLDRREARAFLTEVRRVLRPGGIVRLAAPDLARFAGDYEADGNADHFVERTHMGQGRPRGILSRIKMAMVGPRGHLWMYDGPSLIRLLCDAGFSDVNIMPAGKTSIPNPGNLDLAERAEESVYVEAVQP